LAVGDATVAEPLTDFFRGALTTVCVESDGHICRECPLPVALIPGAFNPLHEAHCRLGEIALELVGSPVAFELSVTNVDKPPLVEDEVRRRLTQFRSKAPVWLTRAPTFATKATLFPGAVFLVGADTAARIVAAGYYGICEADMVRALENIRRQGCRFLVAGRADGQGNFMTLQDVCIPIAFQDLFTAIPPEIFRLDISSTELRARP
jgi:hypothetical protein